jgi:hypothetical protein
MRIEGKWHPCADGVNRPVVAVTVRTTEGASEPELFLVDTYADRTVFSARLLSDLRVPRSPASTGISLKGIGGDSPFVVMNCTLEFRRHDGGPALVRGQFSAFTDPEATDISILGRDVLGIFDIIVSRQKAQVLLLAGNYQYHVTPD